MLQTELISEDTDLRADINVFYKTEPGLDLLVPGEMREIYVIRRSETRIDGRADLRQVPAVHRDHDGKTEISDQFVYRSTS